MTAIFDPVDPGQFAAALAFVEALQSSLEKTRKDPAMPEKAGECKTKASPTFCPAMNKAE